MDLLRLVMAQQPMAKLETLGRLVTSPKFKKMWYGSRNIEPRDLGRPIQEVATYHGELSPESQIYMHTMLLNFRAIFLLSASSYNYFSDIGSNANSFWNAIATGIPEIQARALLIMEGTTGRGYLLEINETAEIPWTPALRSEIIALLAPQLQDIENLIDEEYMNSLNRLMAALGMNQVKFLERGDFTYKVESIRRILNYKPEMRRNREVEQIEEVIAAMIYGGYYYGVLRTTLYPEVVSTAFDAYAYELLHHYVYKRGYATIVGLPREGYQRRVVSRAEIISIRRILGDVRVRSIMNPELLNIYRVLAGEIVEERVPNSYRFIVSNPGPVTTVFPSQYEYKRALTRSTQGLVVYANNFRDAIESFALYARGENIFRNLQKLDFSYNTAVSRSQPATLKSIITDPIYPRDEDLKYLSSQEVPSFLERRATKERRYNEILWRLYRGY